MEAVKAVSGTGPNCSLLNLARRGPVPDTVACEQFVARQRCRAACVWGLGSGGVFLGNLRRLRTFSSDIHLEAMFRDSDRRQIVNF